ncbi:DUF1990 family protein [Salinibacterium sp. ZJ70]|uniref:DUF1990 family protein n=1 Tax=Salinibacterium sp. ZJ70 TaxID=2708084 RepID=UPI001420E8AB|nr:DUF1990 domain-containing protein [Salinibacterium sp. ZJ70]
MAEPEVTYAAVGRSLDDVPDETGFRTTQRDVELGHGAEVFARAAAATMSWQIQRGAGIRVQVDAVEPVRTLRAGDAAIMRVPLWPWEVPCLVVATIDEPRRIGFAYGTLPGHPESGEESFVVEHLPDDSVVLRIRAFSRPATWLFRIGYPAVLLMQRIYTDRYVRALLAHLR